MKKEKTGKEGGGRKILRIVVGFIKKNFNLSEKNEWFPKKLIMLGKKYL
jgi:hypothetical protein